MKEKEEMRFYPPTPLILGLRFFFKIPAVSLFLLDGQKTHGRTAKVITKDPNG